MRSDSDTKKLQAREAYKRFAETRFEEPLGKLNDRQRSEALLAFYISDIYNRLHSPIDEEEFRVGYVDASADLGIDFIHKDDDTVLLIQSKYMADGKAVELKDVIHFQTVFDRLLNGDFNRNQALADALADVDMDRDNFVMKFVTLGALAGQAKTQSDLRPTFPTASLNDRVDLYFFDATQLTEELRNAQALSAGVPGEFEFHPAGRRGNRSPVIELDHAEYPSCVMVVPATELVRLYQQYRDRLFTLNIRNFLGNTATNKELAKTLREEPAHFFYYNNGISCLAESLRLEGDRVITHGLQVINGAQTVRSLARTRGAKLDEALVGIRITQAAREYGAEGRFRNNIVRFNNTQNVIKLADFKSNDPIQQDLKKRFSETRRHTYQVAYVSKRTDPTALRNCEVIPVEEFAKVVYSFNKDPVAFSARTSFLFDDSDSGGYVHVFGNGKEVWTVMPESEFRLRSAIWWISRDFGEQISKDRKSSTEPLEKAALERKWFTLFIARLVLQRSYGSDVYRGEVARLWKGDWIFGEDQTGKWLKELYEVSKGIIIWSYSDAAQRDGFIHRNWVRSKETIASLENYVARAPIRLLSKRGEV
jgi:hypothetical protein